MSIYVVTHKELDIKLPNGYKIIAVGDSNLNKYDYKDNTLDNISNKNKNYCELTALYWIYKNIKEDIIGLCHYRRYFMDEHINNIDILPYEDVIKYLIEYDIILPTLHITRYTSIYNEYINEHIKKDIDNTRMIIELYYNEYLYSFDYIMNSNKEYGFNMFISRKDLIDNYCKWLFDILFKLEKITDVSLYDDYQKRMYGFIAERLFTVWIYKNNLKIKELPIRYTEFDNEKILYKKIKKINREPFVL